MELVERRILSLAKPRMWALCLELAELRDLQVTEAKIWRTPRNRPIVQVIRTQINCLLR